MIGAPKPAEMDPKGEFYTFEKGVEKTGGGKGFADVWFKDHFAIEYNDLRYTPITCFETFPFPEPTEEYRASSSDAARRLDELRRNWLDPEGASEADLKKRTLTNLYNARPTWLDNAHKRLD